MIHFSKSPSLHFFGLFYRSVVLTFVLSIFSIFSYAESVVTISIDDKNPGSRIHKDIYAQFMEHLGRGVYEGIWVGLDSKIPNKKGYRIDVLNALKDLKVPLLRWPGGCFADEYHWQDGIGPREKRKKTVNTTWGGVDDNAFGTHEFFTLAELLEADVYINGNLGTGSPREMAAWLEYMTSDTQSTLANLRRKNGRNKPWKVNYFAVGNESWGCGGTMSPSYYADLYKHFATFLKTPGDNRPILIASGGHSALTEWTQTLMERVPKTFSVRMNAISHHYYTLPTDNWEKHGMATGFAQTEWISTLANTLRIEPYIKDNIAIMDKYDPKKEVGFFVDEWGTWYDKDEGSDFGVLFQQNTIRDAVVAALNLNIFHKYSERVTMTNIAQMVNVLQSMILTREDKMLLTPTYHVYKMHIPFQDSVSYPLSITGDKGYHYKQHSIPKISASAARSRSGEIWLSLVNTHPTDKQTVNIKTTDSLKKAKGHILTGRTVDAHNAFDKPNHVTPKSFSVNSKNNALIFELPSKSVLAVQLIH